MTSAAIEKEFLTNPLKALLGYGQSVWLDYIRRNLITSGELKRLIEEDGLRGMTSNPTIFEKAITSSSAFSSSWRKTMLTAPSAPITAISAVGHANDTSARRCFEFMTTYAPPYALRVMTWTRGTSGNFELDDDRIRFPDGAEALYTVVKNPDSAFVVPYFDNGDTMLVRQWRHAWDISSWEVPAGTFEDGEEPAECASRELAEETGLVAARYRSLGTVHGAAFLTGRAHLFLAEGLTESERIGDAYAVVGLDARRQVVSLYRPALDRLGAVPNSALAERRSGPVRLGGLVVTRQHPMTAKGTVFLALEDETGMVNVTLWPDTWARLRGVVRRHALLLVDGDLQRESSVVNVIAREVRPLVDVAAAAGAPDQPDGVRQLGHAGMRRLG